MLLRLISFHCNIWIFIVLLQEAEEEADKLKKAESEREKLAAEVGQVSEIFIDMNN